MVKVKTFKDLLRQEYDKTIEHDKKVALITKELVSSYKQALTNRIKQFFDSQMKTFESALQTSLNTKLFLEKIQNDMLESVRSRKYEFIFRSDSITNKDIKTLLGYMPENTMTLQITQSDIADYLKKIRYETKFTGLTVPPLNDLVTIIKNETAFADNQDYKMIGNKIRSLKFTDFILDNIRSEICYALEEFLDENGLDYDLDTDREPKNWTSTYNIYLIDGV